MSTISRFIQSHSLLLLLVLSVLFACKKDPNYKVIENQITLQWYSGFADETMEDALLGLKWALASIGCSTLNSSSISVHSGQIIEIQTDKLGLNLKAEKNLLFLHAQLKNSEEYLLKSSIDIGRYITLLIGASEHYYRLVGMPDHLNELKAVYELGEAQGYVNASGVSSKDRIISFSDQTGFKQLFIAEEVHPETGEVLEFETLDLMPNGQVRFGIFDSGGNRINAADPVTSSAGKPGKCMWCHESKIQPLFEYQLDYEGYLTGLQLADTLSYFRSYHTTNQLALMNGIDYGDSQAHQLTELLYISFMEPSAARLANEWGMTELQVNERLSTLTTHLHEEFPFLGDLYDRNEVELYAPYSSVAVSTHVREKSEQEVNLFE